jgi:protein-S-isoprenylcysteine O-methyltransferase Ste14
MACRSCFALSYRLDSASEVLNGFEAHLSSMSNSSGTHGSVVAVKQLIVAYVLGAVQVAIFFVSAGCMPVRAWIFFVASYMHYSVSTMVQYKLNPDLLVARFRIRRRGSKSWDEVLMRSSNLVAMIAVPVVAGLDVGRFYWSSLDFSFVFLGLFLFAVSTFLLNWAMVANPFFEPTVRIQTERGHKAVTGGPYRFVRHPGYLAGILYILSVPLIIGSVFAFIPAGIYAVLFILRTSLEDGVLRRELDGYSQYAQKVRYKLIPFVW